MVTHGSSIFTVNHHDRKNIYLNSPIPALLGDIGGNMGLFIGASILTIIELFDFFYEVIKVKWLIFVSKLRDFFDK